MLEFKKAEICDRDEIEKYLCMSSRSSLEFSFTTLFLWQDQYNMEFCIEDGFLYIRSGGKKKMYLFPVGNGDLARAVEKLTKNGETFYSLSVEQTEFLKKHSGDKYAFSENRDMGDYIYKTEDLASLGGKKLRAKRNHINRFVSENPDWTYEEITEDNIGEVIAMHNEWCALAEDEKGLAEETLAVKKALANYFELGFSGGLIRTKGKVIAFSVGDKLNDNTFLVHIEKAFSSYSGAYQMINREFVKHNCMAYEFVNREDDAGNEGLRKAKLSYRPYSIVKKYTAKPEE